jgi:hypothetical protein
MVNVKTQFKRVYRIHPNLRVMIGRAANAMGSPSTSKHIAVIVAEAGTR